MRIPILLLACLFASGPLAAQTAPADDGMHRSAAPTTLPATDARLRARCEDGEDAARQMESRAWTDTVARPRWRYPAIGAAIGIAAGVLHAHAITRGDYVGIPVEPMYILPPAYGLAGAFIGLLIDSSERERAARR